MKTLVLICSLVFLGACGDIGIGSSHKTITETDDHSVDDHSSHGDTNCVTRCEPVDAENCNNGEDTSALCFLVTRECEGPQEPDGPDLTSVPPVDCVIINPNASEPEEDEEEPSDFGV